MPQSAFVIGGDDDDASPSNVAPAQNNVNGVGGAESGTQMQMVESVKRDPIYVAEKNKSKIKSFESSGDVY